MEDKSHTVIEIANQPDKSKLRQWPQYVGTLLASMTQLEIGIIMAFSAVLIPQLKTDGVIVSPEHQGLLVSITTAGIVLGCSLSTVLLRFMGPRRLMMLHSPPAMVGWILISAAQDLRFVIAGRLLVSFCNAATLPCYPAYISSIAVPQLRGRLLATPEVLCSIGLLVGYGAGATLHWSYMAAILGLAPNVMLVIGFLWLPESPDWLVTQLRCEEAIAARRFYMGDLPAECEKEAAAAECEKQQVDDSDSTCDVLRKMARREALLPILLVTGMAVFHILSGMLAVLSYAVTIFQLSGTDVNEYMCAVILGVTRLVFNVLASGLVDRFGRRPLLIVSSLLSAAGLATLGGYFWAQQQGHISSENALGWLPVVVLIIYMAASNFGIGPLLWTLMGELVPANVSSLANGAILTVWGIVYFGVLQVFPYMTRWLGAHGTFWMFSVCCTGLAAFAALLLPETRGLEMQQVQALFARRPPQQQSDDGHDKKDEDPSGAQPREVDRALPLPRNALRLENQEKLVRRRTESLKVDLHTPAAN